MPEHWEDAVILEHKPYEDRVSDHSQTNSPLHFQRFDEHKQFWMKMKSKKDRLKFLLQHSDADGDYVIKAIEQIDHGKAQSQVEFIKGGIGSSDATLSVSAPKGSELDSVFHFYGEKVWQTFSLKIKAKSISFIYNFYSPDRATHIWDPAFLQFHFHGFPRNTNKKSKIAI